MKRRETLRPVCAAIAVTIGAGIVWSTLAIWGSTIIESWLRSGNFVYEDLQVTRAGEVVITSRSNRNYEDVTYRTLDGKPMEVSPDDQLMAASLPRPEKPIAWYEPGIGWGETLGASDFRRPPVGWYLIRNNAREGRAYFAGFDEVTYLPVGYISRGGFQRNLPDETDWFDVGPNRFQWGGGGGAASTCYLVPNSPANRYSAYAEAGGIPNWLVYLIDGNTLLEIDLRSRSVRTVLQSSELESVGILTVGAAQSTDEEPTAGEEKHKSSARLAVRMHDRIVVMNPITDKRREFPLPESMRKESVSAYSLPQDQLLLQWYPVVNDRRKSRLTWLDSEGSVIREESPVLASYSSALSPRGEAMVAAGIAPVPLGWYVATSVIAPLAAVSQGEARTYSEGLVYALNITWPGLVIVAAIGCVAAWLVWRWQQTYRRSATRVWCTYVFLIGLPALIAYWLEHGRAKLEPCGECREVVPRDRDACAACETPFPAPPLVGKEIFA